MGDAELPRRHFSKKGACCSWPYCSSLNWVQGTHASRHTHVGHSYTHTHTFQSSIQSQDQPIKPEAVVLETSKTSPDLHSAIKTRGTHRHTYTLHTCKRKPDLNVALFSEGS